MRVKYVGPVHDFEQGGFLHPQALVQGVLHVGSGVKIHAFASVGTKPFIFRLKDGVRVPSSGRFPVYMGEDVEIFPRANVDAGSERPTLLGDRVKIDHYVHVGHDAVIGDDTVVTGGVVVCGFVEIGKRCTIGANSVLMNRVRIGDDCMIGAGSVVVRDVSANSRVFGNPAHQSLQQNWLHLPWNDPNDLASIRRGRQAES